MWVLLIFVITSNSATSQKVTGFQTEGDCLEAGRVYRLDSKGITENILTRTQVITSCVRTS